MKVLVKENKGNFIKRFTVNPNYVSGCNFQIDIAEGCPYDCAYCFLKHFLRSDDLIYYSNIPKLKDELNKNPSDYFNMSVLSDGSSLYKKPQILKELFSVLNNFPNKHFEIRFKNEAVLHILEYNPPKNIVFTSTITPEPINEFLERGTSNVFNRLEALRIFRQEGYEIGMILDPIIIYDKYLNDYEKIAAYIKNNFKEIFLLGFGMLRLEKGLFVRFLEDVNETKMKGRLRGEFSLGEDGKYRYFFKERINVYKKLSNMFSTLKRERTIYYMEKKDIEKRLLP